MTILMPQVSSVIFTATTLLSKYSNTQRLPSAERSINSLKDLGPLSRLVISGKVVPYKEFTPAGKALALVVALVFSAILLATLIEWVTRDDDWRAPPPAAPWVPHIPAAPLFNHPIPRLWAPAPAPPWINPVASPGPLGTLPRGTVGNSVLNLVVGNAASYAAWVTAQLKLMPIHEVPPEEAFDALTLEHYASMFEPNTILYRLGVYPLGYSINEGDIWIDAPSVVARINNVLRTQEDRNLLVLRLMDVISDDHPLLKDHPLKVHIRAFFKEISASVFPILNSSAARFMPAMQNACRTYNDPTTPLVIALATAEQLERSPSRHVPVTTIQSLAATFRSDPSVEGRTQAGAKITALLQANPTLFTPWERHGLFTLPKLPTEKPSLALVVPDPLALVVADPIGKETALHFQSYGVGKGTRAPTSNEEVVTTVLHVLDEFYEDTIPMRLPIDEARANAERLRLPQSKRACTVLALLRSPPRALHP